MGELQAGLALTGGASPRLDGALADRLGSCRTPLVASQLLCAVAYPLLSIMFYRSCLILVSMVDPMSFVPGYGNVLS